MFRLRSLAAAVTAAPLLLLVAPVVAHAGEPPVSRCVPAAHLVSTAPLQVTLTTPADCIGVQVTVQAWLSPTADGRPLAAQQLAATGFDDLMLPGTSVDVTLAGGDLGLGCYVQVDAAYGHGRDNLLTPYGADLIAAWHTGDHDCLWTPPTPSSPPVTTPPASSTPPTTTAPPVTTSPPAPSLPPRLTSPPRTINPTPTLAPPTPAPTTTAVPTVTLVPPTATHKAVPPKLRPTSTHPKPKPHHHTTTAAPLPSVSGCVGTGCHSTKPTPAPTTTAPVDVLPYTGSTHIAGMIAAALGMIAAGIAALMLGAAHRTRRH